MGRHTEDFSVAGTVSGFTRVRGTAGFTATGGYGIMNSTDNVNYRDEFDVGSQNMFTEVDITLPGDANRSSFVMTNCVASGSGTAAQQYYAVTFNRQAGTYAMLRYVNGSAGNNGSGNISLPADPFRCRAEFKDGRFSFYVNGDLVNGFDDASPLTGTRGGLGTYNGGTVLRFDNYVTGDLGTPPGRFLIASM